MAVPVRADLLYTLRDHQQRMDSLMQARISQHKQQIEGLSRGLPKPTEILANAQQSLDIQTDKLGNSLKMLVTAKQHQLQRASAGLRPHMLQHPLKEQSRLVQNAADKMTERFKQLVERKENQLTQLTGKLALLDHNHVLKRGFALVKNAQGELVTSVKHASNASTLTFHDGEAPLGSTPMMAKPKPKKAKAKPADELQESLF